MMEYSVLVPCPLTLLLQPCVVVTAIVGMYASVTFLNYVKSIYTIFMYIQSLCQDAVLELFFQLQVWD